MSTRRVAVSISLLVVVACSGTTSGEPTGQRTAALSQGREDSGDPYSVGICVGATPQSCVFRCSGTLVAKNLVLTARHCFDEIPVATVDCKVARFGSRRVPTNQYWVTTSPTITAAKVWHRGREILTPASLAVCGNDIAALVLDAIVPESEATPIAPDLAYAVDDPANVGTTIRTSAYGATAVDAADFGVRRLREGAPITCVPSVDTTGCDGLVGNVVTANEFVAELGACVGDSGAAALDQRTFSSGSTLVIGVLSRGSEVGTACGSGIYVRLDHTARFLVNAATRASAVGEYPIPDWAAVPFAPASLGERCDADADCASKRCLSADDGDSWTCSQACGPGTDTVACPAGLDCVGAPVSYCLPHRASADSDDGCRTSGRGARDQGLGAAGAIAVVAATLRWLRRRRR